jgi:hypothetical protein
MPTEEEVAEKYYTYSARGWPHPIGWENLSAGTKKLWIALAKKKLAEYHLPEGGKN